jgi:hypothetical protein
MATGEREHAEYDLRWAENNDMGERCHEVQVRNERTSIFFSPMSSTESNSLDGLVMDCSRGVSGKTLLPEEFRVPP